MNMKQGKKTAASRTRTGWLLGWLLGYRKPSQLRIRVSSLDRPVCCSIYNSIQGLSVRHGLVLGRDTREGTGASGGR